MKMAVLDFVFNLHFFVGLIAGYFVVPFLKKWVLHLMGK